MISTAVESTEINMGEPNTRLENSEPVFIVGMNGSGTTMLLDCLGRHPDLYAFPRETRVIPYLMATQDRFGDLSDDNKFVQLWKHVLNIPVFSYVNKHQPPPLPADWDKYPRTLGAVLDGVFSYFANSEGKHRWCEKTPQHVQHIEKLAKIFPKAKFIHIIRDGRDSSASFYRRWHRTPELTIYRWKKVVKEGRRQGALVEGRYFELKYEDLTQNPEEWLKRICKFLNIEFNVLVLQSSRPYMEGQANDGLNQISQNSGNWRELLSQRKASNLETIAGSTLRQFGYQTLSGDSDLDPPKWKRVIWQTKDNLYQFIREVFRRLTGKNKKPWWVIIRRPIVAFKQKQANRF